MQLISIANKRQRVRIKPINTEKFLGLNDASLMKLRRVTWSGITSRQLTGKKLSSAHIVSQIFLEPRIDEAGK